MRCEACGTTPCVGSLNDGVTIETGWHERPTARGAPTASAVTRRIGRASRQEQRPCLGQQFDTLRWGRLNLERTLSPADAWLFGMSSGERWDMPETRSCHGRPDECGTVSLECGGDVVRIACKRMPPAPLQKEHHAIMHEEIESAIGHLPTPLCGVAHLGVELLLPA